MSDIYSLLTKARFLGLLALENAIKMMRSALGGAMNEHGELMAEIEKLRAENQKLLDEHLRALASLESRERDLVSAINKLEDAQKDPLTQLPTRALFEKRVTSMIEECRRGDKCIAVMMVDVGGLGLVNNDHGHVIGGDRVLVSLAKILRESIRSVDTVVRWGGDEFAIILSNANMLVAQMVADRILHAVESAYVRVGHGSSAVSIPLKASIGVAVGCGEHVTREIVTQADKALIRAKIERKATDGRVTVQTYLMH